ncbi:hypothetical protein HMPREF0548_1751 [Lactobacillus ultunensis DSM 16047]|uniref:Uncharacterized protein n=1 Tax=Lactobacillus ultunensis DSM 16047 TaxID=525365 RepID=C2EQ05_9LACO|nr:hypothetical protein HMPREF0548_1751 [Lactobacillus ultunensis DSM 16047]
MYSSPLSIFLPYIIYYAKKDDFFLRNFIFMREKKALRAFFAIIRVEF